MVRASSATRLAAMLLLLLAVLGVRAVADDETPPAPFDATAANPAQNEAVERQLDQTVSVDLQETTLDQLVPFLAERKINAVFDQRALEEAGIGSDTGLRTLKVSEISLRSVLDILLHDLDLTSVIRDGKLTITTTEVASVELVTRIYRVDDLVRVRNDDGQQIDDNDSLIEMITSTVQPQTWEEVGGPGTIPEFQGTLIISQTQPTHREIEQVLAALRESRAQQKTGAPPEPIWAESSADAAVRHKFVDKSSAEFDFQFVEEPLQKVVAVVAERVGLQAVLDHRALEEAGIGIDVPITADLRQATLPTALALLLQPLDLTYVLKDEVIMVTTTEVASQELAVVVYPVADLVQYGEPAVGARYQDFDSLIEVLTSTLSPDSWDEVGGPGSISELPIASSLVVSQTQPVQQELARLLTGLRKMREPLPQPPHRPPAKTDRGTMGGGMGGGKKGGGIF